MITLQFSSLAGIASDLIRYYGHDAYAHVDTVLPDGSLLGARGDVMAGVPAVVRSVSPLASWRRAIERNSW